jgi:hypothetical protein
MRPQTRARLIYIALLAVALVLGLAFDALMAAR